MLQMLDICEKVFHKTPSRLFNVACWHMDFLIFVRKYFTKHREDLQMSNQNTKSFVGLFIFLSKYFGENRTHLYIFRPDKVSSAGFSKFVRKYFTIHRTDFQMFLPATKIIRGLPLFDQITAQKLWLQIRNRVTKILLITDKYDPLMRLKADRRAPPTHTGSPRALKWDKMRHHLQNMWIQNVFDKTRVV